VSLGNSICYRPGHIALVVAEFFLAVELEVAKSDDLLVVLNFHHEPAEEVPIELVWLSRKVMQCNNIAVFTPQYAS